MMKMARTADQAELLSLGAITPGMLFYTGTIALICVGLLLPTERYLTPKRGAGYALGIVGGSCMLLLLIYSARKRVPALSFLGRTSDWFRFHMLLGVLGPLCILYHANFRLGATNSNVALLSMLTVAGSGLVGRYLYARIHHGLYGSRLNLGELRQQAASLRADSPQLDRFPELMPRLERTESRLLPTRPRWPLLALGKLLLLAVSVQYERFALHTYIRRRCRAAVTDSGLAPEARALQVPVRAYVDARLAAARRVAGFEAYERLFSLWHALHLPLIFILLVAAVVHVIAVNVY
jgi:hypothetical protein